MKNKYLLILFFVAMIVVIIGKLFKIMHFEYAGITGNTVLCIGLFSETVVVFLLLFKVIKDKKSDFLNQ